MVIAESRLTAQGQVSVPADVRRAGKFSSEDINKALFPEGPLPPRSTEKMKAGIARGMRRRYARRYFQGSGATAGS
ncbi:MAG: AbrB/MazE/SpoVT family DNA-binding domain-containing protein [Acidobacteriia bacterium]|nr:AbrB/MazE/SpoVT family DNA-binding domain-containing protein [Terriglobia bacterium]